MLLAGAGLGGMQYFARNKVKHIEIVLGYI